MTPAFRRDLLIMSGCAAAIVVSLLLVRITAAPAETSTPAASAVSERSVSPAIPAMPTSLVPAATATTAASAAAPATVLRGATRTLQLVPDVTITPRPVQTTAEPASPTSLPSAMPAAPNPSDTTTAAGAASAWLDTLCRYDWRQQDRAVHQRAAQAYGDTSMPVGSDPFTFTVRAWSLITRTHTSSACTNTTVAIDPPPLDNPGPPTARFTTTQVLATDDVPFQQVPLTLTRALTQTSDGHWQIAGPMSAN